MKAALFLILFICLILILYMLVFSLTRKDRLRSIYLTLLCSAVGMYILGYTLEVLSPTLEAAIIANKVRNVGLPLVGPFFLFFILNICQYRALKRWMVGTAFVYGLFMYTCILFNEHHLLYYPTIQYVPTWDMHYLILGHGPLYYLQQAVSVACALAAYIALFNRMRVWSPAMRRQLGFIALGSLVALIPYLLYFTRTIARVDPTPISMTVTLLLFLVGILRYRIYDITGIATETAIESMDDAIVVLDSRWCLQYANASARALFPGLDKLMLSDTILRLRSWPRELQNCTGTGRVNFEMAGKSGNRYFRAHVNPVQNKSASIGWSIVMRDITETTEMLEKMQTLAITDPLTGIYNRRYFMENVQRQLDLAMREKTISCLLIFDLDHFKNVNDSYGHQTGDLVLQMVAEAINKELRSYDLFARYGGEEFALFILNIQGQHAQNFAWRLCHSVEELQIPHDDTFVRVTASFGLVEVPWDASLEQAIQAADTAMYRAKQNGRNRVEFGTLNEPEKASGDA